MGVALGGPAREIEIENVLGCLELILLGLSSAPKLHCGDKVTVNTQPMLTVFLILTGAVTVPYCSWGNWGSEGHWLSSQGSTAGIRWSQDLNPEVSDSAAPWTFYYMGCPIRNNYSGWFINSVCQTTNKHPHVSHLLPAAHNPVRGSWVIIIASLRWEPGVSTRRAATW